MTNQKRDIAAHYEGVIAALVPFAAKGKLTEGLNKFKTRIDKSDLEEIRFEVNRLIAPCYDAVDNQSFAKGNTHKIILNDVELKLDAVGERILDHELNRHNREYTQGVYEAINSEERYNRQVKKEAHEEKVKAFTVDCMLGTDTIDIENIRVIPGFTISSKDISDNAPLPFQYLSKDEISVMLSAKPGIFVGESVSFTFPPMPKVNDQSSIAGYKCKSITALKKRGEFSAVFSAEENSNWLNTLEQFIQRNAYELPLEVEQEELRTRQQILKDTILTNAPVTATLCEQKNGTLIPHGLLIPQGDESQALDPSHCANLSYCKAIFHQLSNEFKKTRETYQFQCRINQNGTERNLVANLGALLRDKTLSNFIRQGQSNGSLVVYRLSLISTSDAQFDFSSATKSTKYAELNKFKYIIYCAEVTNELHRFELKDDSSFPGFPEVYYEKTEHYKVNVCLPDHLNRRTEPRYTFSGEVLLKTNWFKSTTVKMIDVSPQGAQLLLSDVTPRIKSRVSLSLPDFKLTNLRYDVIYHDPVLQTLHLRMTDKSAEKNADKIEQIIHHNSDYFTPRSQHVIQQQTFEYMWELVKCSLPGVHILLGKGQDTQQQLIVAHSDGAPKSLAPFKIKHNKLPTHGWFAGSGEAVSETVKLTSIIESSEPIAPSLFYVNRSKGRFSYVSQEDFDEEETRQKLDKSIKLNKGKLIAHSMQVADYQNLDDTWYHKRCKHLLQVDKSAVGRIRKQESACARVLSILPVSLLHRHLLLIGDFSSKN